MSVLQLHPGGLDRPDVHALLRLHRDEALGSTPLENAHALDLNGLLAPEISFWTAREGNTLLGMAALRRLDDQHAEVKSMRTVPAAVRRGVGRALLDHLIAEARARGFTRLSLETGTACSYDAADRLYETAGFADGPVFGGYPESPHNRFMTMTL